jgi:hypothetical protein
MWAQNCKSRSCHWAGFSYHAGDSRTSSFLIGRGGGVWIKSISFTPSWVAPVNDISRTDKFEIFHGNMLTSNAPHQYGSTMQQTRNKRRNMAQLMDNGTVRLIRNMMLYIRSWPSIHQYPSDPIYLGCLHLHSLQPQVRQIVYIVY